MMTRRGFPAFGWPRGLLRTRRVDEGTMGVCRVADSSRLGSRDVARLIRGLVGGAEFHVLDITALSGPLASIARRRPRHQGRGELPELVGGLSGRKIVLDVKDDQSDPSKAVSLVQQAFDIGQKPDLVLPGVTSNETVACCPCWRGARWCRSPRPDRPRSRTRQVPLSFGASFQPTDGPESIGDLPGQAELQDGRHSAPRTDAFGASWFSNSAVAGGQIAEGGVGTYDPTAIDLSRSWASSSRASGVIVAGGFGAPVAAIYAARVKLGLRDPAGADTTIMRQPVEGGG